MNFNEYTFETDDLNLTKKEILNLFLKKFKGFYYSKYLINDNYYIYFVVDNKVYQFILKTEYKDLKFNKKIVYLDKMCVDFLDGVLINNLKRDFILN